jgi:uncharacterized membrane protein
MDIVLFAQIVAARMVGHHRPLAMLLVMFAVAALIGVAVYVAVRLASRHPGAAMPGAHADAALEQARMRYARGELTRDDYTRVVTDLGGRPPAS